MSCRAVRESDAAQVASGSVALSVASKGLEVKFPAREITYGSENAVLLDGSLAADLGRNSVLSRNFIHSQGLKCFMKRPAATPATLPQIPTAGA